MSRIGKTKCVNLKLTIESHTQLAEWAQLQNRTVPNSILYLLERIVPAEIANPTGPAFRATPIREIPPVINENDVRRVVREEMGRSGLIGRRAAGRMRK